ncbi:hypothetical protein AGRA3207_007628 [Actinomadura graeca]|uniref:Lipoprotein n=1 Tax=Actinomadura graeca TaxID=2750812 RepID=A0ABX8R4P4_9ACTN|nr:RlpA-like double-psi beta-barrel domain-containing protein [Actinomadura graeca]QXJ26041.1 hypothetical protein AGRA3207_007628 [Actinomadura graeca]
MQQRAINVVLTGVTGAALTGMLVAGVAAASDDSAPSEQKLLSQQAMATQEYKTSHKGEKKDSGKSGSTSKDSKRAKKAAGVILSGKTTASYFWDDGSGVNGDTGAPAGGKPMQKGLFASPSWPLHTKVRVSYDGRSITGFVGDRGPGRPSHNGVMLDLDTYTFRYLLDGGKPKSKYNAGTGEGHIKGVKWEVLKWGSGAGKRGAPKPLG